MPNSTGGRGVPRYVKQTAEQQQAYMEQLQCAYMGVYDQQQYQQQQYQQYQQQQAVEGAEAATQQQAEAGTDNGATA